MERRLFILRAFLDLAIELGGRCLIDFCLLLKMQHMYRFKDPEHAECIDIAGVFRCIEADLDVALRCKVIDFVRLYLPDDTDEARRIGHITFMQLNEVFLEQMVDPLGRRDGGPTDDAVHLISLFEKELAKIGAILPGNACD